MEALRTFQNPCACCALSAAGRIGGGDEELSMDAACAHSVLTASWALRWSLLVTSSQLLCHCLFRTLSHQQLWSQKKSPGQPRLRPVSSPQPLPFGCYLLFLSFFRGSCLSLCFILLWVSPTSDSWRSRLACRGPHKAQGCPCTQESLWCPEVDFQIHPALALCLGFDCSFHISPNLLKGSRFWN